MGAPTLDEARRAADAVLAATPNAEVLLYGSLARGEATEHSDVDLYVLYADIDYAQRHEITSRLTYAVQDALNGRSFDLHVSDLPEWAGRSEVSNTFEHEISQDVVKLAGSIARREAHWGKTQVQPMTAHGEALRYLETTLKKEISATIGQATPQPHERPRLGTPVLAGEPDEVNQELQAQQDAESNRLDRLVRLTASCAMVVELSLKAAGVLQGRHPESTKKLGHSIARSLAAVRGPLRQELRNLLRGHGLTPADLTKWRVQAMYPADYEKLCGEADRDPYAYLNTAIDVADRVIAEHEAQGAASGVARRLLTRLEGVRKAGRIRWVDEVDDDAVTVESVPDPGQATGSA